MGGDGLLLSAAELPIILIGRNDADALATGWHPLQEGPAGIPCRWMSQKAVLRLASEPGADGLCITVSAPALIRGMRPGLSVYHGKILLGHCPDLEPEGSWSSAIFTFNKEKIAPSSTDVAGPITLTLAVENHEGGKATPLAFVPHEVLANGDLRELGVQVSSVRWTR